jgi:glutaredoxin
MCAQKTNRALHACLRVNYAIAVPQIANAVNIPQIRVCVNNMKVTLLTAPSCSECELAKRIVNEITGEDADIDVEIADILETPAMAAKHNILSVPAILINGNLEFIGVPKKKELIKKLS